MGRFCDTMDLEHSFQLACANWVSCKGRRLHKLCKTNVDYLIMNKL